jgi:mannose-6-phosphate isomerase class I
MGRGVDFAMDMINFEPKSVEEVRAQHFCQPRLLDQQAGGKEFALISSEQTPCFLVHKLEILSDYVKMSDSFYVAIVTAGRGQMISGARKVDLEEGDRFFVCYSAESVLYSTDVGMEIVLTFPPRTD